MIVIENEFNIGDIIYLKTDEQNSPRLVVDIKISINNSLTYGLCCGEKYTQHYSQELSTEPVNI